MYESSSASGSFNFAVNDAALEIGVIADVTEPGASEPPPQDAVSVYDTTVTYDASPHTIDIDSLAQIRIGENRDIVPLLEYALSPGGPFSETPPEFKNVCQTSVWYRLSALNFATYLHEARVTITKRNVTFKTRSGEWLYDGEEHKLESFDAGGDGYAAGEFITLINFPSIKEIGSIENTPGSAAFTPGTLESNYNIQIESGILSVYGEMMFDSQGGAWDNGQTVCTNRSNTTIALPVDPVREGYSFLGWYDSVTNNALKISGSEKACMQFFFAKWKSDAPTPDGSNPFLAQTFGQTAAITGPAAEISGGIVFPDRFENAENGLFVCEIANRAFANADNITSLMFPAYMTNIGERAFYACENLSEIRFTDTFDWQNPTNRLKLSIGRLAFASTAIEELTVPSCVGSIAAGAFNNCRNLRTVTIESSQTVIEPYAFLNCGADAGRTEVSVPNDWTDFSFTNWCPSIKVTARPRTSMQLTGFSINAAPQAAARSLLAEAPAQAAERVTLRFSLKSLAPDSEADPASVRVAYYARSLSEEPEILTPISLTNNSDGTYSVIVEIPAGGKSAFFRTVIIE